MRWRNLERQTERPGALVPLICCEENLENVVEKDVLLNRLRVAVPQFPRPVVGVSPGVLTCHFPRLVEDARTTTGRYNYRVLCMGQAAKPLGFRVRSSFHILCL